MRAMEARESTDSPLRLNTGYIPIYSMVQYNEVTDLDQEVNAYMAHSQLYEPGYVDPTDSDFPVALLRDPKISDPDMKMASIAIPEYLCLFPKD